MIGGVVFFLCVVVLAGCAASGTRVSSSSSQKTYYESGPALSWGGSGVRTGGTYSVDGFRFRDGKLHYEIREYGPRGRRR